MHVDVRQAGDVIIVDLTGRIVLGNPSQILHEVMDQLVAEGWKKILLNLSAVEWIDSAGIGELVAGTRMAQRFGVDVRLVRVGDRVRHVLSISRLLPLFQVFENEQEALRSFSGRDSTS